MFAQADVYKRQGKVYQILTILLQGVVGLIGIVVGPTLVAAQSRQLLQELIFSDAERTEQLLSLIHI